MENRIKQNLQSQKTRSYPLHLPKNRPIKVDPAEQTGSATVLFREHQNTYHWWQV